MKGPRLIRDLVKGSGCRREWEEVEPCGIPERNAPYAAQAFLRSSGFGRLITALLCLSVPRWFSRRVRRFSGHLVSSRRERLPCG